MFELLGFCACEGEPKATPIPGEGSFSAREDGAYSVELLSGVRQYDGDGKLKTSFPALTSMLSISLFGGTPQSGALFDVLDRWSDSLESEVFDLSVCHLDFRLSLFSVDTSGSLLSS